MTEHRGSRFVDVLHECDATIFAQKIDRALSDVALGVSTTGKVGKVVITLEFKRIESSQQVTLKHALKFVKPTNNGRVTEENATATPMYVGMFGKLTATPDTQESMQFKEASET